MRATRSGFTRFDSIAEFERYIDSLRITRSIDGLQVHHMSLPDYDCFYKSNGKTEDELTRTINLDSYGSSKGWGGIAQHFNIFPNGKITTGRNLNKTPVGITGWNTGKVCIEIYGDFDKCQDKMTDEQRKSVIAVYGILCKKLNITPSVSTIKPHCWFTSGGDCLGDYIPSKARKSCPGTAFMGFGNTKKAFVNEFYPLIKKYMSSGHVENKPSNSTNAITEETTNLTGQVNTLDGDTLNVRKSYSASANILGELKNNTTITIVARMSNNWFKIKYKDGYGYVNSKYVDNIENVVPTPSGKYIVRYLQQVLNEEYRCGLVIDGSYGPKTKAQVKAHYLKKGYRGNHVVWLQKALINRGYNIKADGSFGPATLDALKKYQKSRKLTVDGYCGLDTHTKIIND